MKNNSEEKSDTSYCCFTIIALCITCVSAVLTFLVANYMYTGISCSHDWKSEDMPNKVHALASERLAVPEKGIIIVKMSALQRCFIMPSPSYSPSDSRRFRTIESRLAEQLIFHLAGQKAVDILRSPGLT
ncbi:unnamed protein product [Auanema sp. JU1783]|nr:unnamed protein product [Auanema sp. JU1783]